MRINCINPIRAVQAEQPGANKSTSSYRQIVKSTTILGGSSVVNIILRIIRTKFLAVLLGPSGIGLLGVYISITEMGGAIGRMGIDNSGVRQTAESAAGGNEEKFAYTLFTLRCVSLLFGALGMGLFFALSSPICRLTFGSTEYTSDLMLLSVTILFDTVVSGEVARIQGLRKIGDLAKVNVLSALFGTALGIPILYFLGQKGIVPFIIAASAMSMVTAWWFARKIAVPRVRMHWGKIRAEAKPLLRLGSVIMVADLMTRATMYFLRVLVARRFSLEALGLYQAAMTLSSIYVGVILDAMVKDYYPRLTAAANDDSVCNELVNQQTEIGILLSVPGTLAILTFAPIVLQLLYTAKFVAAFDILQWQILGVLLRVVSWPMGFILQAKGLARLYLLTDLLMNAASICLVWAGISYFGLSGVGIGFFGMSVFYLAMMYCTARYLTGFAWSGANIRNALLILPAVGAIFVSGLFFDSFWCLIVKCVICASMSFYCVKRLIDIVSPDGFLSFMLTAKERVRAFL